MRRFLQLTVIGAAFSAVAFACVNTSFSHYEETYVQTHLNELIMGLFPEHGEAFHYNEISRTERLLAKNPADIEAMNDHAVALLKLKRYDEALDQFLEIDERAPDRYKTYSNLGVLYKKMGQYKTAASATAKALEIKPEGHLGLGDYYLRMLRWRQRVKADPAVKHQENFLGQSRDLSPAEVAADPLVNRTYLETLIKADRHFADAYMILGDVLYANNDIEHASRAWLMGEHLDPEMKGTRTKLLKAAFKRKARQKSETGFDKEFLEQFERERGQAEEWLSTFKNFEALAIEALPAEAEAPLLFGTWASPNKPKFAAMGLKTTTSHSKLILQIVSLSIAIFFGTLAVLLFFVLPLACVYYVIQGAWQAIRSKSEPPLVG